MRYLTIVFSLVVLSSCLTIDMVSKGYTESQARLLVEQGKCRILKGSIERDAAFRRGLGVRLYEAKSAQELYSAIDEYVALDGGNAFFINQQGYKEFSVFFTTMSCDLSNYANRD
jgi:hypothetical protein